MNIKFYSNTADPRVVDKTSHLSLVMDANGYMREECSVVNPVIMLETQGNVQPVEANGDEVLANDDYIVYDYQITDSLPEFNYAYIPEFKRYYFVTELTAVRSGLWRVYLRCDVLMSFKDVVYDNKYYFCERCDPNVASSSKVLDDPLISWSEKEEVTYVDLEAGSQNYKNVTFDASTDNVEQEKVTAYVLVNNAKRNNVFPWKDASNNYSYGETPWETGFNPPVVAGRLPHIDATSIQVNALNVPYVMTIKQVAMFQRGANIDDAVVSNVASIIIWPFEISSAFRSALYYDFYVGDASFVIPPNVTTMACHVLRNGTTFPYLVLCEFDAPEVDDYTKLPNHCAYDVYLPFYGWTPLDVMAYGGDHFIIFYALSIVDGAGSVNLYDTTKGQMVFTAPVQVGRKMILTTTNYRENNIQTQNIALNGVLGAIGGTLGVIGGIVMGNPVLAVGGAVTGVGAIAKSAIQAQSVIERGSISFGSEATNFFSPLKAWLRKKAKTPSIAPNTFEYSFFVGRFGKPLKEAVYLSGSQHGFAMLSGGYYSSPNATSEELKEFRALLESGVFL